MWEPLTYCYLEGKARKSGVQLFPLTQYDDSPVAIESV